MRGMTRIVPALVVGAFLLVVGTAAGFGFLADHEPRPESTPPSSTAPSSSVRTIQPPAPIALVKAAQSGCGSVPMRNWSKGVWKCVLSDDFNGSALDLTRWTVVDTADSGFSSGIPPAFACYKYDPRTVSVSGGYLNLSVLKIDDEFLCGGPAAQPTKYIGGAVSTKYRLAQAYGRFQIRAKFATDERPGLQSSLALLPDQSAYDLKSGEIDIAEYFTKWSDRVIPTVRYSHDEDDPSATTDECTVERPDQFHTYTLQWTPEQIDMYLNGKRCLSTTWSARGGLRHPAPFDQPFYLTMFEALGVSKAAFDPDAPPRLPATLQVDYVRIWGARED
jgi:beta-glucanase (GH16 family)